MEESELSDQWQIIEKFFAEHPEVHALVADFNGEGDSGSIEGARPVEKVEGNEWHKDCEHLKLSDSQQTAADTICEQALEATGLDWYNNDGGYGAINISRDLKVKCEVNTRYTEVNTEEHTYDKSGKEVEVEG